MGKEQLETSLNRLDVWLTVFGVLVAVGVVGESIAGFLHWRRSNSLSAIQERDLAKARGDAATAIEKAATLGVSLANLDAFVKDQQAKAAEAVRSLEQSQKDLNAAIAAANARLAPRTLSETQVALIASRVGAFKGRLYSGMVSPGTPDSTPLWQKIDSALQDAGWIRSITPQYLGIASDTATVAYEPGIGVSVLAPFAIEGQPESGVSAEIDQAATSLVQALLDSGIDATLSRLGGKPDPNPRGIIVLVGNKPP